MNIFRRFTTFQFLKAVSQRPFQLATINSVCTFKPVLFNLTPKFAMSKAKSIIDSHKNLIKCHYKSKDFSIEQLFTGCLAIYSYYIESGDDCFLIDPLIDTNQYQKLISSSGKTLKGIFVSHYHADYLSGQYALAKKYNCKIYMGPESVPTDTVVTLKEKQLISVGKIKLECWHTPGHTMESSCLVIVDHSGKRDTVFTGDTIFLNEVGRPDLAVKTNLTAKDLAGMLYDSIQKLKTLNDDIRILPGHGSGSACGKSIGKGDFCTLGNQKSSNYGLQASNKGEFVQKVLADMPKPPGYFGYNAKINKTQPSFHETAIANKKKHQHLTPEKVKQLSKHKDVVIIDMRGIEEMKKGMIQGSLCIPFDGGFATWVGTLLDPKDTLILFGSQDQFKEAEARLFRIGYLHVKGHINFTINDWKAKNFPIVIPEFVDNVLQPNSTILDVRKPGEWKSEGVVEGAVRLQLSDLFHHPQKLDKSKSYVIYCRTGYRTRIAWSFLKSHGFNAKICPLAFDDLFKSGSVKKVNI